MVRRNWVLSAALVLLAPLALAVGSPPAQSELPADVKTILDKVDVALYNARKAGLKDVSFTLDMPILQQMMQSMGVTEGIKIYWKAPDLIKVDFPEQMAMMMGGKEGANKQMGSLGKVMAGETYSDRLKGYTAKLEKDGELDKITATTTDTTKDNSEQVLWVDAIGRVVKMRSTPTKPNPMMQGPVEQAVEYRKEGDQYLPVEMKGEKTGSVKFVYAQVNGFWLPAKMTVESPLNPMGTMEMNFKDVKANSGLEDSMFKSGEGADKTKPKDPVQKQG